MPITKILVFIDWFYPAYKAGGPVKSVFNLVQALQGEFQFSIVTSNCDVDGEVLNVIANEWTEFQGIKVIYLNKEQQRKKVYRSLFEEVQADCIYYNSLFSKNFTLKPFRTLKRYKRQQIVAPRGMLGSGALAIKPIKKKAFLNYSKSLLFNTKQTIWHATSAQEADEIRAVYGKKTTIRVAQNISSAMVERSIINKEEGRLRMVFVSRIAEKKNLFFALELLQTLANETALSLDIYGPIEEESYWNKCEKLIEKDSRIQYKGVLAPPEIAVTLQQYHFYLLPTLHENYGHSIVEALLAGVPIIISQATPWRDLKSAGIGADLDLDNKAEWVDYFKNTIDIGLKEYKDMVRNCYVFAEKWILNPEVLEDSKNLFV
tara:strand:+ start:332 stop:1456 length:1125 start_codon:yes stop_codon:yes gene_type:complete